VPLPIRAIALCFLILTVSGVSAAAAPVRTTGVSALYGEGFRLNAPKQATLTLDHFRTFEGGDAFAFVDLPARIGGEGARPRTYGEAYVRVSGHRLAGRELSLGPFRDLSLSTGINASPKTFVVMTGPQVGVRMPGFKVLQLQAYAYQADGGAPLTHQESIVWDAPIRLSNRVQLRFRGFADFIGEQKGYAARQVVAQPQLMLDASALAGGRPGRVYVGTEWKIWNNKFGVNGVDENVAQALLTVRL
jgi:nucleoside-specific outer membrane channel protein Tsx